MLVSVASFLPIIVVGPISDLIGTTAVILSVAILIALCGVASVLRRGPLLPVESRSTAGTMIPGMVVDPVAVAHSEPRRAYERAHPRPGAPTTARPGGPSGSSAAPSAADAPTSPAEEATDD
jgi:hypothetical protein